MPAATSIPDSRTRERLLDKAEELFAVRGFENVSLRDLTQAAGANLAAVNYHFGSREALIGCIIERALNPINEERLALLAAAEKDAGARGPAIEIILRAFLTPVVTQVGRTDLSEMLFFKLMGRCMSDRMHLLPESTLPLLEKVVTKFGAALRKQAPGLDPVATLWRLNFTIGALIQTLVHAEMLQRLSKGLIRDVTSDEILDRLVEFCAAGFHHKPVASRGSKLRRRVSKAARLVILAGALVLLASCAAVSPPSKMSKAVTDVPGQWSATKEGRAGVDSDWVRRFRDAKLSALVDEALANNYDLQLAAARIEKARGQARAAGAAGNPSSDLTFNGSRSKRNFIGFPIGGGTGGSEGGVLSSQSNSFDLTLDIKWEADVWGRIAAGKSAARGFLEAAELDAQAARTSIAARVAKSWFALIEAQRQVALAEDARKIYEDTSKAVTERFKAGNQEAGGVGAQLRLAETDVAAASASVAERKQQVAAASRALEILIGRYPSGELKSNGALPDVPSNPPVGLPSELLQRRPDILAAERRYAAQGKRLTEAKRALFPRIALIANTGYASDDLSKIISSDFGVWQLAGNAVQPIFAAGAIQAESDVRYAEQREALVTLQQTVLKAFGEVETALISERFLSQREAAISEAARLAEDADKSARADYRDGVGDMLTVLAAQNRMIQARTQWFAVRRLRLEIRVDLHLALGGDFTVHTVPGREPPATSVRPSRPVLKSLFEKD